MGRRLAVAGALGRTAWSLFVGTYQVHGTQGLLS
jgi:hypothetical protein